MSERGLEGGWISVPTSADGDAALMEFALSYNAYEVHDDFDAVAELSDAVRSHFERSGVIEGSLNELRTTLFFHQRAHRHAGGDDAFGSHAIVVALLDRIREISGGRVRRVDYDGG
jgi:hypothetical protein